MTLAENTYLDSGLYLIGTGVGSSSNMSVGGQRAAAGCEYRFLEGYTSLLDDGENNQLEELVGVFSVIRRPEVESPEIILDLAKKTSVALMIVGDPLQATTHVDLLLRCKDEGIRTEVHHAVSIIDLVCAGVGLKSYKFGRQVTIPFPYAGHLPTSPLEMIADNLHLGLHTLVLLDLDPTGAGIDAPSPMNPNQAIAILSEMVKRVEEDPPPHLNDELEKSLKMQLRKVAISEIISTGVGEKLGVLCSNMGSSKQKVSFGTLNQLSELEIEGIHSLVVLGSLSGLEEEALKRLH